MNNSSSSAIVLDEIEFNGSIIGATRTDDGRIWVSVSHLCDALGVDRASQHVKIKNPDSPFSYRDIPITASDGKSYQTLCIENGSVQAWLFNISPSKVAPDVKPKLIKAQREVHDIIWNHYNGRGSIVAASDSELAFRGIAESVKNFIEQSERNHRVTNDRLGLVHHSIDVFDREVKEIKTDVGEVMTDMGEVKGQLRLLSDHVMKNSKRRVHPKMKDDHVNFVLSALGECPCCFEHVSEKCDLHVDHFRQVSDVRDCSVWAICVNCNTRALNDPDARGEAESNFKVYQKRRAAYRKALQPMLPGFSA